ncbi:MAG: metalloprotease TldD [Alphaproteobacteria bacterium]|nr:metalloprotease TldD [Alphaproteobacteria bacterium]
MSALFQTDTLFFAQTGMDPDAVQGIVRDALVGMDDGELYLEFSQSEGFSWDDGKLKSASFDTAQGFGLRAVADEAVGFAHAVNLDEATLRRAAKSVAAVRGGHQGTMQLSPRGTNAQLYPDLNPLNGLSFEKKVAVLQEIDAYARSRDPRVHQVSASLSAEWQAVQIIRADGWRGADIRPIVSINVSVVTRDGERLEAGSSGAGTRGAYDSYVVAEMWQSLVDRALHKALVNLEAKPAKAGEMTVVLGPGWPAVLLHEAVGHGLEGDYNRKKTSPFASLLGQKVAAEGVTIVDDGTIEGRRGSLTIDDEGTPSQRTTLIENGVLVGYLQDRMNARLMGGVSTGNGRRESFACKPCPRMTNTMMLGGAHDPQDIIASVKNGIYAADIGGGQVDITSGKFVFTTTEAYEIENGKIGRPVKGASLVGTGFESLKKISMIGNDFAMDRGVGNCGKNGQQVPVGIGQPTLRLDNMTVGGSSME